MVRACRHLSADHAGHHYTVKGRPNSLGACASGGRLVCLCISGLAGTGHAGAGLLILIRGVGACLFDLLIGIVKSNETDAFIRVVYHRNDTI